MKDELFYRIVYEDDCVRLKIDEADTYHEAVKKAQQRIENYGLTFKEENPKYSESIRWKCLNPPSPKLAMAIYIERSYDGEERNTR